MWGGGGDKGDCCRVMNLNDQTNHNYCTKVLITWLGLRSQLLDPDLHIKSSSYFHRVDFVVLHDRFHSQTDHSPDGITVSSKEYLFFSIFPSLRISDASASTSINEHTPITFSATPGVRGEVVCTIRSLYFDELNHYTSPAQCTHLTIIFIIPSKDVLIGKVSTLLSLYGRDNGFRINGSWALPAKLSTVKPEKI